MKELTSKITITTFLLVYLFFCGTLYLISFWSTFDFDITNYIELLDIPKSFIYPLTTGVSISVLVILIKGIVRSLEKVWKDEKKNKELLPRIKELPTKTLLARILNDYNIWIITILFICLIFYRPRREWVFSILCITLIIFSITTFIKSEAIIKLIPRFSLRLLFAILLFFIPIDSFAIGKLNAIEVWKNRKYFIVV